MPVRILLVDDVADIRLLLRLALETDDRFEVVGEAADGLEAIELAGQLRPDVVLLDLAMPRLDGMQAIPRIHQASPGVKIVVLSGFDSEQVIQQALQSCASVFLQKGTSTNDIAATAYEVSLAPPKSVCVP